jgi:hypothetical protein
MSRAGRQLACDAMVIQKHSPSLTASDKAAAPQAGDAGHILGGVHSALYATGATVVEVVS